MQLAIATASAYPTGYRDTINLIDCMRQAGIEPSIEVWDDVQTDWSKFDVILLHTTWDYTDKYEEFIEWCHKVSNLSRLINSFELVKLNSTKHYLLDLQSKGAPIPPTFAVASGQAPSIESIKSSFDGKVVVKPLIDAGGDKARLFSSAQEALPYIAELAQDNDLFVQEYVPEIINYGEQSAILINGKLSHVVNKKPSKGEFRVQEYHGGITSLSEKTDQVEDYCLDILDKLGQQPVYARVDFVDATTRLLMEVEMIEPDLFLRFAPESFAKLTEAILQPN